MASLVLDAALEAQGRNRRTSYSRTEAWYSAQGPWLDSADYSYTTVVESVDALVKAGLLGDHDKVAPSKRATGWQSSYTAGAPLCTLVVPASAIVLPPKGLLRLRDRTTKDLLRFPDTDGTRRQHRWMERQNEAQASYDVWLDVGERRGHLLDFTGVKDGKVVKHTVDTRMTHSYRVFSGDRNHGGRLYGHYVQGVPSALREGIILCGEKSEELDFSCLHARFMYALAGILLSEDYDPYTAVEWGESLDPKRRRKLLKQGFNVLVNARNHPSATGAIASKIMLADGRKGVPEKGDYDGARAMIAAIKRAHPDVEKMFHQDLGVAFQKLDSEMMVGLLNDLTLSQGIPALAIHDSLIVPIRHKGKVQEAMKKALSETLASTMEKRASAVGYRGNLRHVQGNAPALRTGGSRPRPSSSDSASAKLTYPRRPARPASAPSVDSIPVPTPSKRSPAMRSLTTLSSVCPPVLAPSSAPSLDALSSVSPSSDVSVARQSETPPVVHAGATERRKFRRPSFLQPGYREDMSALLSRLAKAPLGEAGPTAKTLTKARSGSAVDR